MKPTSNRSDSQRAQEILKKVRRIEISTRRIVDSVLSGQYHTRFKGQGMQFSDLREYYHGDDIRHIDWKVTARTQTAHIKKFEEERELNVYFIVDVSGSGEFGSKDKSKHEALSEVAALLAFAAVKNGDKVGLILFSDKVERHIPPKKGRPHALRLVTELLYHEPQGRGTDLAAALDFCWEVVKTKAVVFVISDFFAKDYERSLRRLSRRNDVIALRMRDQREVSVPAVGLIEMQDAENGEPFWVNTSSALFKEEFGTRMQVIDAELDQTFGQAGVEHLDLWTHEDYFNRVVEFFRKRRRKR